jgi:hypothetical protein
MRPGTWSWYETKVGFFRKRMLYRCCDSFSQAITITPGLLHGSRVAYRTRAIPACRRIAAAFGLLNVYLVAALGASFPAARTLWSEMVHIILGVTTHRLSYPNII